MGMADGGGDGTSHPHGHVYATPEKPPDLSDLLPDAWLQSHPEHRGEIDHIRKEQRDRSRRQKSASEDQRGVKTDPAVRRALTDWTPRVRRRIRSQQFPPTRSTPGVIHSLHSRGEFPDQTPHEDRGDHHLCQPP